MIEKNLLTITILEGIEKSDACPLCYLWLKNEERHMEHLLTDEVVMDPDFREKLVLAKGFCNYHMHLLYKTAQTPGVLDGLGYALYMKDIIGSIVEGLRLLPLKSLSKLEKKGNINILSWREKRRQRLSRLCDAVKHAVQAERSCPACESLRSLDEIHLHTLLQMLDDGDFRKDFQSSKPLCLPHFLSGVGMVHSSKLRNSTDVARTLIEVENRGLQTMANHLSEFIRKQSWDYRNEPRGAEGKANHGSLHLLAGAEGLHCKIS